MKALRFFEGRSLPILVLVILCSFAGSAVAQINTEAMLTDGRSDPWSVYADFSLSLKRGNTETTRSTIGGGARRLTLFEDPSLPVGGEPWFRDRFMLSGSWSLEQAKNERVDHVAFMHARWTRMWIPRVGSEVFAQMNYAQFQRLNRRLLFGGGVRAVVFNDALAQFWFGSGLFLEEEDFDLSNLDNPDAYPSHRLNARWSSYVTLKVNALDQKITFINTLYVQPTLADFGDIRVLYEGRVTARIYKSVGLSFSSNINYDSTPVPGIARTDIRFGGALQFRLYGKSTPVTPVHVGPSQDELDWLAYSKARPVASHRLANSVKAAQAAARAEVRARAQRKNRALADAGDIVYTQIAYATQRANIAPSGTRHLDAYKEPNANAAMEAAFTATSVLMNILRTQTPPAAAEHTQPAAPRPLPTRKPQADTEPPEPALFDPVID